jgi:plasmid stability protein
MEGIMPDLIVPDVDESTYQRLQERAAARGHSPQAEARLILAEAVQTPLPGAWGPVRAIHDRLAASGRQFTDSVDLVREDRER